MDERRSHVWELAFEIGVRSFGGLRFEADGEGGGFDPMKNVIGGWGLGIG